MGQQVDIDEILRIAGQNNTKVVLVVPGKEPVVLLPLSEYEQITSGTSKLLKSSNETVKKESKKPLTQPKNIENIDNPSSMVESDDEYYPEPLE